MERGPLVHDGGANTAERMPIGRHLVDNGSITSSQLVAALQLQTTINAPLGEILVAEGIAKKQDVEKVLAQQFPLPKADFDKEPIDTELCKSRPPRFWVRNRLLPWKNDGERVLIATERPDRFDDFRGSLEANFGSLAPALGESDDMTRSIGLLFGRQLALEANERVAAEFSCRSWHWSARLILPLLLVASGTGFYNFPTLGYFFATLVALSALVLFACLRFTAFIAHMTDNDLLAVPRGRAVVPAENLRKPKVSVLVPLYREKEIVKTLVARLSRLTYPKAVLEVLLVLEERDDVTRRTLAETTLPRWMRVVEVPAIGGIKTKPRAMNYALDFCGGEIVGVWDAEDAPAFDQIERVVERFASAPDDVVCLQGVLDYYNPRTNWISRCFTIEYAAWFRVILPGLARLGLIVPLGGTTLFFRRDKLEELGGWDAHNVTEDADLGVRLSRWGYRTEMIDTVTYEEANCRVWPWIKQRSRWLKGFMVTYVVHMRRPLKLYRDIGPLKFLSFQAFFLGTLSQFLLAPFIWTFWLFLFGIPHPLEGFAPYEYLLGVMLFFFCIELMGFIIAMLAVSKSDRRFLMIWVPAMLLYFPLGTVAAIKALVELMVAPYYWDKTQHGVVLADECV